MRITYLLASLLCASLVLWPTLPSLQWLWLLWVAAPVALLLAATAEARLVSLSLLCCVAAITLWQGHRIVANLLPANCSHQPYQLRVQVTGLPTRELQGEQWRSRFEARVLSAEGECPDLARFAGKKLLLSWFTDAPELSPGQLWQLQTQLRRPRGQVNPRGQDYQLWLMQQGIYATGSVRSATLLGQGSAGLDGWRAAFRQRLYALPVQAQARALLMALTLGDRSALSVGLRNQLQNSGTAHLLAISGLHIGLGAALGYWLGRGLSVLLMLCLPLTWRVRLHGLWLARACALALACLYAGFGGLSVSTLRALLMVSLFFLSNVVRRHWLWIDIWCLVVLLLLLINPLQGADPGFYLSAGAVLVLIAVYQGRQRISRTRWDRLRQWLKPQWWIFVGLLPLSVLFFGGFSPVSVAANSLAIPWVSLVVVPLALLGLLLSPLSDWLSAVCLHLAARAIDLFLMALDFFADHGGQWQWLSAGSHSSFLLLLALAAVWLILPKPGGFQKALTPLALLAALAAAGQVTQRPDRQNRLVLFDVGQGLSLYLEAGGINLLYDTGPPFGVNTSAMEKIVLPFLRSRGVQQLDYVIVSHNDADHAGGMAALLASGIKVQQWLAGERDSLVARYPLLATHSVSSCHHQQFDQSGLWFWFPGAGAARAGNDASCVLWLQLPELVLLLPGDISAARERVLAPLLPVTDAVWLVAPHHGSRSSSSYALLSRLPGARSLVSAGYRNRYQHPSPLVTARYRELGLGWYNTAEAGALVMQWGPGQAPAITGWRQQARRFWRD